MRWAPQQTAPTTHPRRLPLQPPLPAWPVKEVTYLTTQHLRRRSATTFQPPRRVSPITFPRIISPLRQGSLTITTVKPRHRTSHFIIAAPPTPLTVAAPTVVPSESPKTCPDSPRRGLTPPPSCSFPPRVGVGAPPPRAPFSAYAPDLLYWRPRKGSRQLTPTGGCGVLVTWRGWLWLRYSSKQYNIVLKDSGIALKTVKYNAKKILV